VDVVLCCYLIYETQRCAFFKTRQCKLTFWPTISVRAKLRSVPCCCSYTSFNCLPASNSSAANSISGLRLSVFSAANIRTRLSSYHKPFSFKFLASSLKVFPVCTTCVTSAASKVPPVVQMCAEAKGRADGTAVVTSLGAFTKFR
jgi:hypothetical protein